MPFAQLFLFSTLIATPLFSASAETFSATPIRYDGDKRLKVQCDLCIVNPGDSVLFSLGDRRVAIAQISSIEDDVLSIEIKKSKERLALNTAYDMKKVTMRKIDSVTTSSVEKPPRKANGSNRLNHRFGVLLTSSIITNPATVEGGLRLEYHLLDFMSLTAGYDKGATLTTQSSSIGGGINFYVPTWSLSPRVGARFQKRTASASFTIPEIPGFTSAISQSVEASESYLSIPFGLSWQARNGFHLLAGAELPLKSDASLFYLVNAGWFF